MRRHIRSCSTGHTIPQSDEHGEGHFPGVVEPADAERNGERAGQETGGREESILWWQRMILYYKSLKLLLLHRLRSFEHLLVVTLSAA